MANTVDSHHLVPRWLLKKMKAMKKTCKKEWDVTRLNNEITIRVKIHGDYNMVFGGRTAAEAYIQAHDIFDDMVSEDNEKNLKKLEAWNDMFDGNDADAARYYFLSWLWYYLFKNGKPCGLPNSERVYTPTELFDRGILQQVFYEQVSVSFHKREAWDILFGHKTRPESLVLKEVTEVFNAMQWLE